MKTLNVDHKINYLELQINRPESKNAIDLQLLQDLNDACDIAEKSDEIRTIVLKGDEKFFCTGMDFKAEGSDRSFAESFAHLLKRFTTIPKTVISICEGKVMAGGVGFVAASDIVIAKPSATFCLSEALWGLLPANVLPYLIRRVGFQPAYFMTLSTKTFSATEVKEFKLVDVLSDDPENEFKNLNKRLSVMHPETLLKMKSYFRQMWILNEKMEQLAIDTLVDLREDPLVRKNIKNFVENGKLPWEK